MQFSNYQWEYDPVYDTFGYCSRVGMNNKQQNRDLLIFSHLMTVIVNKTEISWSIKMTET